MFQLSDVSALSPQVRRAIDSLRIYVDAQLLSAIGSGGNGTAVIDGGTPSIAGTTIIDGGTV